MRERGVAVMEAEPVRCWLTMGTTVACPHCNKQLYRLLLDVLDTTHITGSLFDPLPGVPPVLDNQPNPCPECRGDWFPQWYHENLTYKRAGREPQRRGKRKK